MSDAKKPISSIVTPTRLEYDFTPGVASTRFLRGMNEGRMPVERKSHSLVTLMVSGELWSSSKVNGC